MEYKKCCFIVRFFIRIGALLWEPAFNKGYENDYDRLTLFEKLGYHMFVTGYKMRGLTEEDLNDLMHDYDKYPK